MTEYWLLKKTLGTWTKVSWWSEEENDKAERSYAGMINSGYAIRLVRVQMVMEHLLDDMLPEPNSDVFDLMKTAKAEIVTVTGLDNLLAEQPKSIWGAPEPSGWGNLSSGAGLKNGGLSPEQQADVNNAWTNFKSCNSISAGKAHGIAGKVWMGNPITKEKKRVDPSEVTAMMANGWMRCGPRTVL